MGDAQVETALARERKHARERLHASCAELTGHINSLRRDAVDQRHALTEAGQNHDAWRENLQTELAARLTDLETQVTELGGALASRLQTKINSMMKSFDDQGASTLNHNLKQHLSALDSRTVALETTNEIISNDVQACRQEQ